MNNNSYKESKILLVEDEKTLAVGLEFNLVEEGYLVEWAKTEEKRLVFLNRIILI